MFWSLMACSLSGPPPAPEPAPTVADPIPVPERDVAGGCVENNAVDCVAHGNELSASGNDAEATEAWARACELGSNRGCVRILAGKLPSADGEVGPSLLAEAVAFCKKGDALACAIEGRERISGRWLDKDEARGRTLLYQSCQNGIGIACEMFQ